MGKVKIHKFKVIVEEKENSLTARVEDIPGLKAQGKDIDEVMKKLEDAIIMHLEQNKFNKPKNTNPSFPTFNQTEARA
jgi:predicted RNase H-like HicB family nuclease